jgi:hypothetical protein
MCFGLRNSPSCEFFPDLALSNYRLSPQYHLADTHLKTLEEIRKNLENFIDFKTAKFFSQAIYQLLDK